MLKVTATETPDNSVAEAVSTRPALPPTITRVDGAAARLKSKGPCSTTSVNVTVRVKPPPIACIVITVVELGAVADAEKTRVVEQVGLQVCGEFRLPLTPEGNGVGRLNLMGVVIPDTRVALALSIPREPPVRIVRDAGVATRLKSNAPPLVTTSAKIAILVKPPPVAWIVRVVLARVAVADAVRVIAAEQVGLQVEGVNALAVTPIGSGVVMLKLTGVVILDTRVADAVSTPPAPPVTIVSVAGAVARLKSEVQLQTAKLKVVVRVIPPPTA